MSPDGKKEHIIELIDVISVYIICHGLYYPYKPPKNTSPNLPNVPPNIGKYDTIAKAVKGSAFADPVEENLLKPSKTSICGPKPQSGYIGLYKAT